MSKHSEVKGIKLQRNYCCDRPGMFLDILTHICNGFDELQGDEGFVMKEDMLRYVMSKSRGHWNPMIVLRLIDEFRK